MLPHVWRVLPSLVLSSLSPVAHCPQVQAVFWLPTPQPLPPAVSVTRPSPTQRKALPALRPLAGSVSIRASAGAAGNTANCSPGGIASCASNGIGVGVGRGNGAGTTFGAAAGRTANTAVATVQERSRLLRRRGLGGAEHVRGGSVWGGGKRGGGDVASWLNGMGEEASDREAHSQQEDRSDGGGNDLEEHGGKGWVSCEEDEEGSGRLGDVLCNGAYDGGASDERSATTQGAGCCAGASGAGAARHAHSWLLGSSTGSRRSGRGFGALAGGFKGWLWPASGRGRKPGGAAVASGSGGDVGSGSNMRGGGTGAAQGAVGRLPSPGSGSMHHSQSVGALLQEHSAEGAMVDCSRAALTGGGAAVTSSKWAVAGSAAAAAVGTGAGATSKPAPLRRSHTSVHTSAPKEPVCQQLSEVACAADVVGWVLDFDVGFTRSRDSTIHTAGLY